VIVCLIFLSAGETKTGNLTGRC